MDETTPPDHIALVRYGLIPQVARFGLTSQINQQITDSTAHRLSVVVESDRGTEVGELLEVIRSGIVTEAPTVTGQMQRIASEDDLSTYADNKRQSESEFFEWQDRIEEWKLQLQVIDVEWMLDRKNVVLYVLNEQDAETTRLALLAAAGGFGIIHVQPVNAEGVAQKSGGGGGCGSGGGGCGSGGCGS